ncbi:MAG: putative quinol monooxygenase [Rikenellaceae bacterium]
MSELKIIATIVAKEEFASDVRTSLNAVVDGTRTEEGNVSYVLHQDVKNPLKYVIIEVWKSLDAIDAHNATAHFNEFVKSIDGKMESLDVSIIKEIY